MIFIILGTQKFQLNRLLQEVDLLCQEGKIKEEVFAQKGNSDYIPQNYNYVDFLDREQFSDMIKKSSLIITHSGVGSIITALRSEKPVIVYPRLKKFNEHVDNHQIEIAEAFEKRNFVFCCYEDNNLSELIEEARNHEFDKYISSTDNILRLVGDFLECN